VQEELRRVLPVIQGLRNRVKVPLSVDTTKLEVAQASIEAGASIINDVGANRNDPALWALAAKTGVGYVLMHAQGNAQTMQVNPHYQDVVQEVGHFFEERLERIGAAGVSREQLVLDVGLGFGKSLAHNLQLLAAWRVFRVYRRPLLLGASRKSFIGKITGQTDPAHRLHGSLACACWAAHEGVEIIRTHDVAATRQAVKTIEALASHSQHVLADHRQGTQ
jgi:dihydropteroate synthase